MKTQPLTTEELLKLTDILANRYRGYQHKDDLKQEAILAYYEAVEGGNTDISSLTTIMRKRMNAFANYKSSPVKVPVGGENYKYMRVLSSVEFDELTPGGKALYQALHPETHTIDSYEDKLEAETMSALDKIQIRLAFEEQLSDREKEVLCSVIFDNEKPSVVGNRIGVTQQRVSQIHTQALLKLKEVL